VKELEIQLKVATAERQHAEAIIYSISDAVLVTDPFDELVLANESAARALEFDLNNSERAPMEKVLAGGTAYITDLGMTGPIDSVIGVDKDIILQRFMSQMPVRFEPAKGPAALHGVVITVDPESGRATDIQRLRVPA